MEIILGSSNDRPGNGPRHSGEGDLVWSEDAIFLRALDSYYSAIFDGHQRPLSAAAVEDGRTIAAVDANLTNGIVAFHARPAEMGFASSVEPSLIGRAVKLLCDHLMQAGKTAGASHVLLRDRGHVGVLSRLAQECLRLGGEPEAEIRAIVDLSQSEKELRSDLRKSYRHCVNWGEKNLLTRFVCRERPSPEDYDLYRQFHHRIAGRVTRTPASWERMFDLIAGGQGELVLGYLDDQLVAATITTYSGVTATYASGVYERSLFDKPLAHWPLFLAILRARQVGMRFFDIGEIPQASRVTPKEHSIGYFKRGFTSRLCQHTLWRIVLNRAATIEAGSASVPIIEHVT